MFSNYNISHVHLKATYLWMYILHLYQSPQDSGILPSSQQIPTSRNVSNLASLVARKYYYAKDFFKCHIIIYSFFSKGITKQDMAFIVRLVTIQKSC